MTGCGLEGAGPFGPGVLGIFGTLYGLRHDLNLGHALAALTVGSADAVGTSVTTTDDQHVLALGGDAFVLGELHACEDAVLLRQHLEGEVDALQFAAGSLQVTGGGGTG